MTKKQYEAFLAEKRGAQVYFVLAASLPEPLVKIGTAQNLAQRFNTLEGSSPVALTLLGSIAGATHVERWCHYHCIEDRAHHEWFHWNKRTLAFVELLIGHGQDVAAWICAKHWRADVIEASGRHVYAGTLRPLPQARSSVDEYLDAQNKPSKIESCGCARCLAYEQSRPA